MPIAKSDFSKVAFGMGLFVFMSISGCVGSPGPGDDCGFYPDREYLSERWGSLVDRSTRDFNGTGLDVNPWDPDRHDWDPSSPPPYADWDQWPEDSRPQFLWDLLCYARGRDIEKGESGSSDGGATTADEIAREVFVEIHEEIKRQTGQWLEPYQDSCCVVRFADVYYEVEVGVWFITAGDGHIGPRTILMHEGHIETGLNIEGEHLADDGSDPLEFYVKQPTKLFHVEATWDDPDYALDLVLRGPTTDEGEWDHVVSGGEWNNPERPLAITIWRDDVEDWRGYWNVTMKASDVAMNVDYRLAVTLFHADPVLPDGHSRLN